MLKKNAHDQNEQTIASNIKKNRNFRLKLHLKIHLKFAFLSQGWGAGLCITFLLGENYLWGNLTLGID